MTNINPEVCSEIGANADPVYFGVMPIVDWINTAHFNSFFRPMMTEILTNRDLFNDFDTFNQWGVWVEPFGFYTQFKREARHLQFNQYTIGLSAGAEITFFERLLLGLGAAYSYCGVEWEDQNHRQAGVNSLYLGPTFNYVFSNGYLGCSLIGVANLYHITRDTNLFPKKILKPIPTISDYMSFDLLARIEGGLSYTPGGQFYFYPTARFDYLNVFEQEATEQLDEETEMTVDGLNESFLCSKIGLKISREFYNHDFGYLIPSISFGWINFTPATTNSYQFHIGECQNIEKEVQVDTWSQYFIGAAFNLVHKKALVVGLEYELNMGAESPLQTGNIRIELSW